jgi:restriction system protein
MFFWLFLILITFLLYKIYTTRKIKHENEYHDLLLSDTEMKKTLALGLYQRFCVEKELVNYSQVYLKEDPLAFEHFVADVMKYRFGGHTFVSKASGDFGVDIEHDIDGVRWLGQVKCYRNDLSYEAIARIHSNMVKHNCPKGFVVTTGGYTKNAYEYAEGLDVELIDGVKLVEYWIEGIKQRGV